MDDIKPPQRGSRPPGHGRPDGSFQPQTNNQYGGNTELPAEQTYQADEHPQSDYQLPETKKNKGKGKTIALVLFILLFIASAGAAVWLYLEQQKSQDEIDELNSEAQRLTTEIYQLRYDTRDAQQKMQLYSTEYNGLVDIANELKTACGDTCSNIEVPEKQ